MSLWLWWLKYVRGFRIGHPKHYSATLVNGAYATTGQDVGLTYVPAIDNTPNQFTFTDQNSVALSSTVTSAAVTISGLGSGVSITLNASGGTIDLNGNGVFLGSQIVGNGDTVRARITSSSSGSSTVTCVVAASPSGVQDVFSATTMSGSVGSSVVAGVINVDSGLAGAARLYVRWSKPTANTDASKLHDLKTFKLYVGTSSAESQIVNGLDFSTTAQKSPTECRITGLVNGATYYVRVTAVDAFGNESAASSEFSGAAAAYSAPSRSYTDISSTATISSPGDYRLSADFSGKVSITSSGVYLYGNSKTITHTTGHGVELSAGVSNVWVDAVSFAHASGTGSNINILGDLGTGCQFSQNTLVVIAGSAGIRCSAHSLNGARIWGNYGTVTAATGDETVSMVSEGRNFLAYNNTCVNNGNAGRSGMFGGCLQYEGWANDWSSTGTTYQAFFHQTYGGTAAAQAIFLHDNSVTIGANSDTVRTINLDGQKSGSPVADVLNHTLLWNTFVANQTGSSGPFIRVRGPVGPVNIGYNTFDMGGGGAVTAISYGDDENGGGTPAVYGGNVYRNASTNYGSNVDFGFYGGSAWTGTLNTWNNSFGKQGSSGGDGTSGNWDSNNDSFSGTVSKLGSSTWREFGITLGGSNPFSVQGAWIGFNGLNDTPSAPGTPAAVTGVA